MDHLKLDRDLKFILETEQGRSYLYELLDFCGLYKGSFTGNSETFYREGQRNVGLKIFADIGRVAPEAYIKMMSEIKIKKEKENKQ